MQQSFCVVLLPLFLCLLINIILISYCYSDTGNNELSASVTVDSGMDGQGDMKLIYVTQVLASNIKEEGKTSLSRGVLLMMKKTPQREYMIWQQSSTGEHQLLHNFRCLITRMKLI